MTPDALYYKVQVAIGKLMDDMRAYSLRHCACCAMAIILGMGPAAADVLSDVSQLRGQVIYLDFWASWCGPCKQSFPWMQSIKDRYAGRNLSIIAVNLDQERIDADRFLSKYRPTFDVRFDPAGHSALFYGVHAMPTGVLIDRQGRVRFTHVGFKPVDESEYEAQLTLLLSEPQ